MQNARSYKWLYLITRKQILLFLWMSTCLFVKAARRDADICHYTIHLRFDQIHKKAISDVTLSVQFHDTSSTLQLAAHQLHIYSAKIGNTPLAFTCDTIQHRVTLMLDRRYAPDEKQELILHYETRHVNATDPNAPGGSFGQGIRFIAPSTVNPAKRRQLWAQGELLNTSWWLPCSTNPLDLCTTECIATVESGFTFITNGQLQHQRSHPDGTVTFCYKSDRAFPVYLMAFAMAEYAQITQTVNTVQLHTFCYPNETEAAKATTVRFPDMLKFMEELTGFPYPFQHYAQVMLQDYPFPGLTGQHSFGLISDNFIDDYSTHQDYQYLWDGVSFYALAGQWFGTIIQPERVSDLWLSKGFAQYFEGLYTARNHSEAEYQLWYHPFENANCQNDWDSGNRHPIVPDLIPDTALFATDSYARYRGALVLRMLRAELGDTLFFRSIAHFIKQHAFKPVQTSDFIASVNTVSGKDLNWFFKQWLYQTGYPVFQIKGTYNVKQKRYTLLVQQKQKTDTGASYKPPLYFKGKMTIEIDQQRFTVFIKDQPETTFSFTLPKEPEIVLPDAEAIWIKELQMDKPLTEWRNILLHSKTAAAQNTALTELVRFVKDTSIHKTERQHILSALKGLIESNAYWRLKLNALTQLQGLLETPYNEETIAFLKRVIRKERAWVKAAAITALGMSRSSAYNSLYSQCLSDSSERVISAAAVALGKTNAKGVFEQLLALKQKPSWKNQSLLHCLNGMALLDNARVEPIALAALADNKSPRWSLGNGWDYPFVAVQTLKRIGKTGEALKLLLSRFQMAINENNTDDVFYQTLLISTLGDPKGREIFEPLKQRYKQDENALSAIQFYESQLNTSSGK